MPASVSSAASISRPSTDLVGRLASSDRQVRLKALRDLKNQIIGNRTKKLTYIKLGAVPAVASVLADAIDASNCPSSSPDLVVQSAAALGSFACGVEAGVRAVIHAGALPHLIRLLSSSDEKVNESGARSLKMIYQSKLAPKFDFSVKGNMDFLLSLLNCESENANGLGAGIITHSCETSAEQKMLCDHGVLAKLIDFLEGSTSQRDSSLESLASVIKDNAEVVSEFVQYGRGSALNLLVKLTSERSTRTRLLACACLIIIRNVSPGHLKDKGIENKLISYLLELLEEPGQVGDEASFTLSRFLEDKEDLQKLAFNANAIDILSNHLQKDLLPPKRLEGILLSLANLCSRLEACRAKLLPMQAFDFVNDALRHDSADVRAAACMCMKSVSRSVQNLSAGVFMDEKTVLPLLQLLHDPTLSVQLAALRAISNVVIDFRTRKSSFVRWGGVKQLVQLSMSINPAIRSNSLWALKNLTFDADYKCKEGVYGELTASSMANLISDPEPSVQEQALALLRNLIDGNLDCIQYALAEDGIVLDAIGRQLERTSTTEVGMQGMYVLNNVASGREIHKDAVMEQLLRDTQKKDPPFTMKFLQSNDSRLRTASVWVVVNLTNPSCLGASSRIVKLRNAGIISQLKNMVNDPCLDVKLRVRTILGQYLTFGDS